MTAGWAGIGVTSRLGDMPKTQNLTVKIIMLVCLLTELSYPVHSATSGLNLLPTLTCLVAVQAYYSLSYIRQKAKTNGDYSEFQWRELN